MGVTDGGRADGHAGDPAKVDAMPPMLAPH
jgi:hypothetical protein